MSVIDPAVSVRLSASGARRLAGLLDEVTLLLEDPGPVQLTDEQAGVLGRGADRDELVAWTRTLTAELRSQL
ncbi:hypothetical protein [Streptomyces sp. NPDC097981]|uniref:hypothetical protein n=1 Tax=Streptomyces sp. NPDC097981 TaxID=3155428 RepID=UPI0033333B48